MTETKWRFITWKNQKYKMFGLEKENILDSEDKEGNEVTEWRLYLPRFGLIIQKYVIRKTREAKQE